MGYHFIAFTMRSGNKWQEKRQLFALSAGVLAPKKYFGFELSLKELPARPAATWGYTTARIGQWVCGRTMVRDLTPAPSPKERGVQLTS
jgi:hypothetical protein